jgi:hypothetical protein
MTKAGPFMVASARKCSAMNCEVPQLRISKCVSTCPIWERPTIAHRWAGEARVSTGCWATTCQRWMGQEKKPRRVRKKRPR